MIGSKVFENLLKLPLVLSQFIFGEFMDKNYNFF